MNGWVEIIIAFTTGVLGPLSVIFVKNYFDRNKKKPDMVVDALRISELVTHKIDEIKDGLKADRVWVTQFHNGGHFYPTGKSITKFSIMYESVSTGVSSVQSNYQNIPVHLFSKSLNQLVNVDSIEIPDFEDGTIATYGLRYAAEESGSKSTYLFAIKTIDGKFIGVLGIDYTKNKVQLDDEVVNNIMIHASSLGGVLINHLSQ
jgi:hypothetical protein